MAKIPLGYRSPFNKISSVKSSPMKAFQFAPALFAAAPGVISAVGSLFGRKKRKAEQEAARKEMAEARKAWESIEYKNPYADLTNPYAENVMEDLTVNTQSADYLRQQQQQSQANIMQGLQGAAGGSGVAGLAQSMANIASGQAQRASASIGQQERANELARAKGAQLKQKGQFEIDQMQARGEHWKRKQEQARTTGLFSLSIDRMNAADRARQTAREGVIKGIGQAVAGFGGTMMPGGVNYKQNMFGGGGGDASTIPTYQGIQQNTVSTSGDYNGNGIPDSQEMQYQGPYNAEYYGGTAPTAPTANTQTNTQNTPPIDIDGDEPKSFWEMYPPIGTFPGRINPF